MIDHDKTIGEMLTTLDDLSRDVWIESAPDPDYGHVTVIVARGQRGVDVGNLGIRLAAKLLELAAETPHDQNLN